jgi:hypothetical protein
MYMTCDIVGSYHIRHVYDLVCIIHDVLCRMLHTMVSYARRTMSYVFLEGAVPAVSKESDPGPLPTAKANRLCLSYSKVFIFSLATSKTVSETLSLW